MVRLIASQPFISLELWRTWLMNASATMTNAAMKKLGMGALEPIYLRI
jgi:hypothetical protein